MGDADRNRPDKEVMKWVHRFHLGILVVMALYIVNMVEFILFYSVLLMLNPEFSYHCIYCVVGYTEYCEYPVTEEQHVRLSYRPILYPQSEGDWDIDPNDWQHELFAHDFIAFGIISIPYYDFEISQDTEQSWCHFWRYPGRYPMGIPSCEDFAKYDDQTFWMWMGNSLAITHNGGETWNIQNIADRWANKSYSFIRQVTFDSAMDGQIWSYHSDTEPALFTHDGGITWQHE